MGQSVSAVTNRWNTRAHLRTAGTLAAMDTSSLLRARAAELGLRDEEIETLSTQVDEGVVQALLGNLILFQEALEELNA